MRGTGLFLALGIFGGVWIGRQLGYVVWGVLIGMAVGILLATAAGWLLNRR